MLIQQTADESGALSKGATRRVELGTFSSLGNLEHALRETNCRGVETSFDFLYGREGLLSPTRTAVEITGISVGELGFPDGESYDSICKRAAEYGLERCPVELPLQLCLQYPDPAPHERLYIGMQPLHAGFGGDEKILRVTSFAGYLRLSWHNTVPRNELFGHARHWRAQDIFLFKWP